MAGTIKTLYPPLVNTYMPAFLRTSSCRVYFSLSQYNNVSGINPDLVQVSVTNINTNISALRTAPSTKVDSTGNVIIDESDKNYYPLGIFFTSLKTIEDGDVNFDGATHYIDIPPFILSETEGEEVPKFGLNQTYKVQIRLTSNSATPFPKDNKKQVASWINNNLSNFSEWSRVTLIRGISKPTLVIKGFNDMAKSDSNQSAIVANKLLQSFAGELTFEDKEEEEYLKYIRVKIYRTINRDESHAPVFDSGEIYTSEYSPNEFYYIIKYILEEAVQYTIVFDYMTINGYTPGESEREDLEFVVTTISRSDESPLNIKLITELDEENGRMKVSIRPHTASSLFLGNIVIRRASSEDGFRYWEDLHFLTFDGTINLETDWYDYTIKSGVTYDYGIQRVNEKQLRGVIITAEKRIMAHFDDMYLGNENMQLKVRFDPKISSYKTTVLESKIETIGSKFPYFKRNANVKYRQFPISGLITQWCDKDGLFLNKENIYGDMKPLYDKYNEENKIPQYQDFFYEREFREKVMDFLYADDAKLFRSTTEGNIIVKLMDISFTPNETLGRMIYSFSATAYEMADANIENYDKYKIQTIGEYQYDIQYLESFVGQVTGTFDGNSLDLISGVTNGGLKGAIKEKVEGNALSGYIYELSHLSWVRFTFQSAPYPIIMERGGSGFMHPRPATKAECTGMPNDLLLGYIVYINDEPIIVSQKGYYELNDEDTMITSIRFPDGAAPTVKIDYTAKTTEKVDNSNLADRLTYYYKIGQLYDVYPIGESIIRDIFLKYYNKYYTEYWRLISVDAISIETEPGTIVYVKDSFSDEVEKHIVGETGILAFECSDSIIDEFYFGGKRLNPAPTSFGPETPLEELKSISYNAKEDEYIDTGIQVEIVAEIKDPIEHGVYAISVAPQMEEIEALKERLKSGVSKLEVEKNLQFYLENNETEKFKSVPEYCYIRGHWYPFYRDENNIGEVAYPVSSLIDYKYELVKGEWFDR